MESSSNMPVASPLLYVPKMMFFTKGKGIHKDNLTSFELALRDAEIADLNLVAVSSIKPPHCKITSTKEGRTHLRPGQIVFTIMARSATNEPNRLIAASIGLAMPADDSQYGYLSEHHSTGETAQKAGDYAEDMAMEMLATTLGLPNDPSLTWDQKEEQWKLSGKIYKTQNFTQSAEGNKDGLWTTVVSAAVLIL
ncbi:arginine decarboxylase [Candidatus Nitrososphaera evergladensis SR1]|jgi:arginine decarboxylase|uniref:Pyruvoyl-dependent arginine decarboxylase n=1 Tax=Candidatus Nitrososphaera evergladensis SR1 TaxID=1459636 RepID=A0A075MRM2_9ARCH|nr:arginine decarboxylase, pyruvoyl-dependent [Candidatus Nitrososphaera evergladensis]AIF84191.1 arginine decarboxylase [Candidatus Nitrososphaera evergladensis SR1]